MGRKCFVPSCTSGYKSNLSKVPIFKAPKDENRFNAWKKAILRADRELQSNSSVCALHFPRDMIITTYDIGKINGETQMIDRERVALRHDAIPCIFPNLPSHLSKVHFKRRSPRKRNLINRPLPERTSTNKIDDCFDRLRCFKDLACLTKITDIASKNVGNLIPPISPPSVLSSSGCNYRNVYSKNCSTIYQSDSCLSEHTVSSSPLPNANLAFQNQSPAHFKINECIPDLERSRTEILSNCMSGIPYDLNSAVLSDCFSASCSRNKIAIEEKSRQNYIELIEEKARSYKLTREVEKLKNKILHLETILLENGISIDGIVIKKEEGEAEFYDY